MNIQRLISMSFATAALASASVPALAFTVWPDVDFEWYADVGRVPAAAMPVDAPIAPGTTITTPVPYGTVEIQPAPRAGYIWAPGHWENRGERQVYISGHYVKDDYERQVYVYNNGNGTTTYATGPTVLYDRQGNIIPTSPDAYPIDSARR
jgi:hypothetical protein